MTQYRVPVLEQFSWQPPVADKDLTAPPGGESKGDRYIVGGSATGDWSTHDNDIATYDGASWLYDTPSEGWSCWVSDEDVFYNFDGSNWVVEEINAISQAVSQATSELQLVSAATVAIDSQLLLVESETASNNSEILLLESECATNATAILSVDSQLLLIESEVATNTSGLLTKQSEATYDSDYGVLLFEV